AEGMAGPSPFRGHRPRGVCAKPGCDRADPRRGGPLRLSHLRGDGPRDAAPQPGPRVAVHGAEHEAGERRRRLGPPPAPRPFREDAGHQVADRPQQGRTGGRRRCDGAALPRAPVL
ncbi:MAG: hypothetical protein AVDCRST_MAG04-964, partial [uncultured Acetobacteraceae bacterium]